MEPVHYSTFAPIFCKLNRAQKTELAEFMGIKFINHAFKRDTISNERYQQLLDFVNQEIDNGFSKVNDYKPVDTLQQKVYLIELNNLINSKDFQLYNNFDKTRIIEEQKKIHKYLIN